jgi:hypothetical protein
MDSLAHSALEPRLRRQPEAARYTFHDLTLEVESEIEESAADLKDLLRELSWERTSSLDKANLSLLIRTRGQEPIVPPAASEVLRTDAFLGFQSGNHYYLTDGASVLHLDSRRLRAEAALDSSFFAKPERLRQTFWTFGLLKLLRPLGIYSLHAAGLVGPNGLGILVVGESGSGKSTLTVVLIRQGWRYLSDEAVLLRRRGERIDALSLRRDIYVDEGDARWHADLASGPTRWDRLGKKRQRLAIEAIYPAHRTTSCTPRTLVFPRIASSPRSNFLPLDQKRSWKRLLAQSGPQLFDRDTMPGHLAVLQTLLLQTKSLELRTGRNVYDDPEGFARLFAAVEQEK